MKKEYFTPIKNPMTVIALYIGLSQIIIGVLTVKTDNDIQNLLAWFFVIFTAFCAGAFFLILGFRPKNLYGPGDFNADESFVSLHKILPNINKAIEDGNQQRENNVIKSLSNENARILVDSLPDSVYRYLFKVVNKPMPLDEHIKLLAEYTDSAKYTNVHGTDFLVTLGYFHAITSVLLNRVFTIGGDEKNLVLNSIHDDTMEQIAQKLGKVV